MILLAFAEIRGHFEKSSINTKRRAIFLHSVPTVNYLLPRGETLFHLPRIDILEIFKDFSPTTRKYAKTFHQQPKNIQRLFACKIVLAANHQYPGNIQRLSGQQQPAKAISSSNQQKQPAAATSSSNQQ